MSTGSKDHELHGTHANVKYEIFGHHGFNLKGFSIAVDGNKDGKYTGTYWGIPGALHDGCPKDYTLIVTYGWPNGDPNISTGKGTDSTFQDIEGNRTETDRLYAEVKAISDKLAKHKISETSAADQLAALAITERDNPPKAKGR